MKLGLFTAALPELSLEACADWAAENGFGAIEVACWPAGEGAGRRYAGVCHIDMDALSDEHAHEINTHLAARGLEISSLGYYPNQPAPRPRASRAGQRAPAQGDRGGKQAGRENSSAPLWDATRTERATEPGHFGEVWPAGQSCRRAQRQDRDRELPDDLQRRRVAGRCDLALLPAIWREMFRIIPDENFGSTSTLRIWSGSSSTTSAPSTTSRSASSTLTPKIWRSTAMAVRAWCHVERYRLAGSAAAGARRGALGSLHQCPLRRRLRSCLSIEHEDRCSKAARLWLSVAFCSPATCCSHTSFSTERTGRCAAGKLRASAVIRCNQDPLSRSGRTKRASTLQRGGGAARHCLLGALTVTLLKCARGSSRRAGAAPPRVCPPGRDDASALAGAGSAW